MTSEMLNTLQTLFSEKQAYVIESRMDGDIIIFPETFIRLLRETFTTDCMAKMSEEEVSVTQDFIRYQDGDTTNMNLDVMSALDTWIMNIINCEPNPVVNACYTQADHIYKNCGA